MKFYVFAIRTGIPLEQQNRRSSSLIRRSVIRRERWIAGPPGPSSTMCRVGGTNISNTYRMDRILGWSSLAKSKGSLRAGCVPDGSSQRPQTRGGRRTRGKQENNSHITGFARSVWQANTFETVRGCWDRCFRASIVYMLVCTRAAPRGAFISSLYDSFTVARAYLDFWRQRMHRWHERLHLGVIRIKTMKKCNR